MNCTVYYDTKRHIFFFLTSGGSIYDQYGCYRTTSDLLNNKYPLIITQSFITTLDNYKDNPDFLFLGDYFIPNGYNHNLKETLLSEYPELFI